MAAALVFGAKVKVGADGAEVVTATVLVLCVRLEVTAAALVVGCAVDTGVAGVKENATVLADVVVAAGTGVADVVIAAGAVLVLVLLAGKENEKEGADVTAVLPNENPVLVVAGVDVVVGIAAVPNAIGAVVAAGRAENDVVADVVAVDRENGAAAVEVGNKLGTVAGAAVADDEVSDCPKLKLVAGVDSEKPVAGWAAVVAAPKAEAPKPVPIDEPKVGVDELKLNAEVVAAGVALVVSPADEPKVGADEKAGAVLSEELPKVSPADVLAGV